MANYSSTPALPRSYKMIPQDTARSFQDKSLVTFSNVLRATMSEAAREPAQGQFPFNKLTVDKYSN